MILYCGGFPVESNQNGGRENMQAETNSLGYEPVGKLLGTFAVPSIISMVVSTLYNIVDQIFIGRGVGYSNSLLIAVVLFMCSI